jgi:hypothetical protein
MAKTLLNLKSQSRAVFEFPKVEYTNPVGRFYLLKDGASFYQGSAKTMVYNPQGWQNTEDGSWYYPQDNYTIELSTETYNPAYVGKTVYVNIGDQLLNPTDLGYVAVKYEDLFATATAGEKIDFSRAEVTNDILLGNSPSMYVIDIPNSPDYSPATTRYWFDGDANISVIRITNTYNAMYDGLKVFTLWWNRMRSGVNDGFTEVLYQDLYVGGVLDVSKFPYLAWVKDSANADTFNIIPEGYNVLSNVNDFKSFVLGTTPSKINSNTLYADNAELSGQLNVEFDVTSRGHKLAGFAGSGGDSWVQTPFNGTLEASGHRSFAAGNGAKATNTLSFASGNETLSSGFASNASGNATKASADGSHSGGKGVFDGTNPTKYVTASGIASFNHSRVTALGIVGAAADNSAILGGINNQVQSGAINSVVLGGSGITATQADTVYVPNLVITGAIKNLDGSTATPVNKSIDLAGAQDGVNKTFTFTESIIDKSVMVYINGLMMSSKNGNDFTYNHATKTITFVFAPEPEDNIVTFGSY